MIPKPAHLSIRYALCRWSGQARTTGAYLLGQTANPYDKTEWGQTAGGSLAPSVLYDSAALTATGWSIVRHPLVRTRAYRLANLV